MSNLPPGVRDSDISKAADAPPILPLREYLDSLDDGQRDEFERVFSEKVMASLIVSEMMSRDPKKIWQEFCDNLNDFAADAQQNHRTFSRRATGPSEAEQRAELYGQMQDLIHRRNLGHAIGFIHTCYTRAVSLSRDGDKESICHSAEICSIIGRDPVRVTAPTIPGLLPALIADLEKMLAVKE